MDEDIEQQLLVMRDAKLEGNTSALAALGGALASMLGVAEAGGDACGLWLRWEVHGASQRMRWIEPGRFLMGSPETEAGRVENEVQHPVVLTQGFWLGEVPVMQSLWAAVMGNNPSRFQSPERPVEQVRWEDCKAFCEKLAELVPGLYLRPPSEAEWEYAARAGTTTATYNGDLEIVGTHNAPVLDEIAWYSGNSGVDFELEGGEDSSDWLEKQYAHTEAGTHPVRGKRANGWGLHDMLGNVFEWCQDAMEYGTPYEAREQYDPLSTAGSRRVIRGGSWHGYARYVRAAYRFAFDPGLRFDYLGFRLAGGPALRGGAKGQPRDGDRKVRRTHPKARDALKGPERDK